MKGNIVYISVMGTMGSGKTTVARLLARSLKYILLEENFGENAFLPRFYQDMKRWAFHSQTFFLMEKISQIFNAAKLLKTNSVIQDTPIYQDAFSYAKAQHVLGNIDDAEWRLYQKIYKSFKPYFKRPDLIIFLKTSVAGLISRIDNRGRGYEKQIPESYIELLDMLNNKWISENTRIPLLSITTDDLDVVHSSTARDIVVNKVKTTLNIK
ncbi:hypothetical protein A2154_00785 [Candidatus Gottesmanbacteria bacterium RBG_16_43_7]|uniref:Deoxynucleoside kinase domain-containing protein n=1 Tax=Candidatus Gottesmanbacteria bacterium RBG_16_43_7 TaxID=1798373 RepID=A0A1F5Z853_9BACT|nr:MAG: hypothetical protein A2154_00785 [Candidatus Gottesmanbacteria bacterium RBG_16_43_7]